MFIPVLLYRFMMVHKCFWFLNRYDKDPRQFKNEERVYLSNFGINVVSEVLKEELSSLIEQKGAFIFSISHELRTPLHSILANCELMEESKLSEAQAELVKTIQDFAKLENEKNKITLKIQSTKRN
uniref:Signal transduction histidine kinase dimerisation/phosphoacceptor domain-containing protein n=2 Tax=Rhizophagus irregularis (strain DAOM 181602 / DAOM 197198 / MUCL 43194) TaxID=747089 RepID=U9UK59_RHIID